MPGHRPPPDDLYDCAPTPACRNRHRLGMAANPWTVTDDWPETVPVTEAEIAVLQSWFGDILDRLFDQADQV